MKRSELIRKLTDLGCIMIRHGGKHDWFQNPDTGMYQPVPRHSDINEHLAKQILKKLQS
jgi:mRNA interferase HicA